MSDSKRCTGCGQVKPLAEFYPRADGHHSACSDCHRERSRRYYQDNGEQQRARSRRWREANLGKARDIYRRWRDANPEKKREITRRSDETARALVLAHYGTVCACCGTTKDLGIDHVNGGGDEHRRELGRNGGAGFYRWLIDQGYPAGFQVLCGRCNASKSGGDRCRLYHPLVYLASLGAWPPPAGDVEVD